MALTQVTERAEKPPGEEAPSWGLKGETPSTAKGPGTREPPSRPRGGSCGATGAGRAVQALLCPAGCRDSTQGRGLAPASFEYAGLSGDSSQQASSRWSPSENGGATCRAPPGTLGSRVLLSWGQQGGACSGGRGPALGRGSGAQEPPGLSQELSPSPWEGSRQSSVWKAREQARPHGESLPRDPLHGGK